MKAKRLSKNLYLVCLEEGEELISTLKEFCQKNKITSGFLTGIGAAKEIEILYFEPKKKKYLAKKLFGNFEVCSLTGNIATFNKKILLHCHIVVGNKKFNCTGGHLKRAIVSPIVEIKIERSEKTIKREVNKTLNLLALKL